jgi:hypothetical protein
LVSRKFISFRYEAIAAGKKTQFPHAAFFATLCGLELYLLAALASAPIFNAIEQKAP